MKKIRNKIIISFTILALILITYSIIVYLNNTNKVYLKEINSINSFKELSNEFVYFGRPSCVKCEIFEPILNEVLREEKKEIYYFNIDFFRNNLLLTEDDLNELFEKYKIIEIPTIIKLDYDNNLESLFSISINDLDDNNKNYLKDKISEFILYEEFPDKFVPQYNILILLFVINLIILLLEIIYKSKNLILKICFIISIFTLILLIICFNSILNYLDLYNLSGNTIMFYIYISTMTFNIISIIIPIFKKISKIFN